MAIEYPNLSTKAKAAVGCAAVIVLSLAVAWLNVWLPLTRAALGEMAETARKNMHDNMFFSIASVLSTDSFPGTDYNALMAYSGMLRIQSCRRYGDIENLTASKFLWLSMNVRSDFDRRFSSALTSIGIIAPLY